LIYEILFYEILFTKYCLQNIGTYIYVCNRDDSYELIKIYQSINLECTRNKSRERSPTVPRQAGRNAQQRADSRGARSMREIARAIGPGKINNPAHCLDQPDAARRVSISRIADPGQGKD